MAISFARTAYSGNQQVFWRGESKVLPGGFKPKQTFSIGTILKRGSLVQVDFSDLSAAVIKVGTVITGGTTTKPRVSKDNYFEVGDSVIKSGETTAKTISAIDRSNAEYDVITLNSALTGLTAGDFLVEADTSGETPAQKYTANAVLTESKEILASDITTLDCAYGAVVIKDLVPSFPDSWLTGGIVLATNPNIVFIRQ
jgi:hypothetical protein